VRHTTRWATLGTCAVVLTFAQCGDCRSPRRASSTPPPTPASGAASAASDAATVPTAPSPTPSAIATGDASSPEDYLARFVPLACDYGARCARKEIVPADCLRGPSADGKVDEFWGYFGSLGIPLLDAEARLGRLRFDASRTGECLRAVQRWRCGVEDDVPSRCDPLVRAYLAPAVALGGACRSSQSCIDGYCDAKPNAEGKCVHFLAVGATCDMAHVTACGPDARCRPESPDRGKCARRPKLGQACDGTVQCETGYCARATVEAHGSCRVLPSEGELCSQPAGSIDCQPGLYCDLNAKKQVCKNPLPKGSRQNYLSIFL
jgi:hypothetical protein